jgi:Gram-negative bacterial TonB protein C-terminal
MARSMLACLLLIHAICQAQTATVRHDSGLAEDSQLRAEAVRLMERAAMLTTPVWPANEELVSFRVLNPAPGEASEGTLAIGVKTTGDKRWEFSYGAYKYIRVQNGAEFATYRTDSAEPAAVTTVRKSLPAFQGQFDSADVVRRISDATVDGHAARCIDFDTIQGDHQQSGQACVDARSGFLLLVRQGNETLRQSAYFRFNNASLPGHVERWAGNQKLFEIDSKVVIRTEFPPGYFDYPADAKIEHACRAFSRAYADLTPQPETKAGSHEAVTVKLHGRIGKDGKPTALKVLDAAARADLAEEALRVVSGWSFHPAMCEYQPATQEMDFEVRFKGW